MSDYSNKLIKVLPVKKNTNNIRNQSRADGQLLIETDEKHRLYVDYAETPSGTPERHLLIDSKTILDDFETIEVYGGSFGRTFFRLYDENDIETSLEIPASYHRKAINKVRVIKDGDDFDTYFVGNNTHAIEQPMFYIELANPNESITCADIALGLTGMDYYLSNLQTGDYYVKSCSPIQVETVEYYEDSGGKYLILKFPKFNEVLYGVDTMADGDLMEFDCYFYMNYDENSDGFWRF